MKGKKDDGLKLRMDLIPPEAIEELAKVLTYGANKYGSNNWQNVEEYRYVAALMRHLNAYRKGEKYDSESNLLHLSHMLANVSFLLHKALNASTKRF